MAYFLADFMERLNDELHRGLEDVWYVGTSKCDRLLLGKGAACTVDDRYLDSAKQLDVVVKVIPLSQVMFTRYRDRKITATKILMYYTAAADQNKLQSFVKTHSQRVKELYPKPNMLYLVVAYEPDYPTKVIALVGKSWLDCNMAAIVDDCGN